MEFISPAGRFDGFHCIRIEEILKVDAGTKYLFNLVKVYRHYGEEIPALKVSPKNVLENFIDFVIKSKRLCTMEIGFETLDKISGLRSGQGLEHPRNEAFGRGRKSGRIYPARPRRNRLSGRSIRNTKSTSLAFPDSTAEFRPTAARTAESGAKRQGINTFCPFRSENKRERTL